MGPSMQSAYVIYNLVLLFVLGLDYLFSDYKELFLFLTCNHLFIDTVIIYGLLLKKWQIFTLIMDYW